MDEFELTKDDWELTLKQLKSARAEQTIALELTKAGIAGIEAKLRKIKEKGPHDRNYTKV